MLIIQDKNKNWYAVIKEHGGGENPSPCSYITVEKGRKLWYNKVSKFRR